MRLKLADFGGALQRETSEEEFINEQNLRWTAPEFWLNEVYGNYPLNNLTYIQYIEVIFFCF